MLNEVKEVITAPIEVAKAMGITLKQLLRGPVTNQFPDEPAQVYPRFRGRHTLKRYENGLERCIGCALCAAACPTGCIYVEAAENTDEDRHSPGERYAKIYDINMLRCIFCGYCAEACPTEAIVLEHDFTLAEYDRWDAVYSKERLLEPNNPEYLVVRDDEVFVKAKTWSNK
ncbi:NADH-quinone oxidoreductase subunit NuoI [Anaerolineales bacterium HSG24]|nr:NADH-quinone oxidoreductase subunit NuoI [Anaerolineales bacterium HSG24]